MRIRIAVAAGCADHRLAGQRDVPAARRGATRPIGRRRRRSSASMHRASAHWSGPSPGRRSQRRIHATSRFIVMRWSRQGKSAIVNAVNGASRQNSPAPDSNAEPGPNNATVGVPVSRREMRDAGIGADDERGLREQVPQLADGQRSGVSGPTPVAIDGVEQRLLAATGRQDDAESVPGESFRKVAPAHGRPLLERGAGARMENAIGSRWRFEAAGGRSRPIAAAVRRGWRRRRPDRRRDRPTPSARRGRHGVRRPANPCRPANRQRTRRSSGHRGRARATRAGCRRERAPDRNPIRRRGTRAFRCRADRTATHAGRTAAPRKGWRRRSDRSSRFPHPASAPGTWRRAGSA